MGLEQAWILVLCIGLVIGIGAGLWMILKNKETKIGKSVLFANTKRLTESSEYKQALSRYKKGIAFALAMLVIGVILTSFIAAKPVSVVTEKPVKYNRDIVLCLDVSGSMTYTDAAIIDKFQEMTEGFKGERISLVIFNTTSNQVFPLTDDYEYIQEQFKSVKLGLEGDYVNGYDFLSYTLNGEGASLIGDGLTACTLSFDKNEDNEKRSKSVILATDNIINGTELVPLADASEYAKNNGVTVYGINPDPGTAQVEADALQDAVENTGGSYFSLTDPMATSQIIDKITSEETSAIVGDEVTIKTDAPQPWIFAALLVLLAFMGLAWRFKV